MAGPATKLGSLTAHGGTVIGPGCPTVHSEKTPAIRVGADMHLCPIVTPGTPPVPHVGMNNIVPGVPTVLIGKMPCIYNGGQFPVRRASRSRGDGCHDRVATYVLTEKLPPEYRKYLQPSA